MNRKKGYPALFLSALLIMNVLATVFPTVAYAATTRSVEGGSVVITAGSGDYVITGSTTTNVITISSGYTGTVTLSNVSIQLASGTAIEIQNNANVTVVLEGKNELQSGPNRAGISVLPNATVIFEGKGFLTAVGGANAAGIGGNGGANKSAGSTGKKGTGTTAPTQGGNGSAGGAGTDSGTIVIKSGNIIATGSDNAAGIGGGGGGNGGNGGEGGNSGGDYIFGAAGGNGGNGGNGGSANTFIMLGGEVIATGGTGIGGGIAGKAGGGGGGGTGTSGGGGTSSENRGRGGDGGNGGNGGNSGNILVFGGALKEGSAVTVATAGAAGNRGSGRVYGNNGVAGKAGSTGPTFVLTDNAKLTFFGTASASVRFRTTDYRSNTDVYLDISNNAEIADILNSVGISPDEIFIGKINGTDGSTSTYLPKSYCYAGNADLVFYSDAEPLNEMTKYAPVSMTTAQLRSNTQVVLNTGYLLSYDGNGHTSGVLENSRTMEPGTVFKTAVPLTRIGHDFMGWNTAPDGSGLNFDAETDVEFDFGADTVLYANWYNWMPALFTVQFETNGGTAVSDVSSAENALLNEPVTSKTGHVLAGWYKDAELTEKWDFAVDRVASSMTLYAGWEAEAVQYMVQFETNGGTAVSSITVAENSLLNEPATIKTGHVLTGWYKDAALTQKWNFAAERVTAPITLYAGWETEATQYTVQFETNGGTAVSSVTVAENTLLGEPATIKAGHTLTGWYRDAALTRKWNFAVDHVTASMTLYAGWTPNVVEAYNLRYNGNGQTSGSMQNEVVAYNATVIIKDKNNLVKNGYTFAGWSTSASGAVEYRPGDSFTMPNYDVRLYAVWTPNELASVRFETNGGTVVTPITGLGYGDYLPKVASTRTGYTFTGWYKEVALRNLWDFNTDTVTGSMTLYAGWEINEYNLRYNGNGQTSGSMQNEVLPYNATVAIKNKGNLAKAGHTFVGWSTTIDGDAEYQPGDSFTMPAYDVRLYALWASNDLLNVQFITNGGTAVAPITGLRFGEYLPNPVTAKTGYSFTGWYKDMALRNKWDFDTDTIKGNMTLYAGWAIEEYDLKYNGNGQTSGSMQNEVVQSGAVVIIKDRGKLLKEGYTFGGWSTSLKGPAEYLPGDSFTMPNHDVKLYAVWIADLGPSTYTVRFEANGGSAVADMEGLLFGDFLIKPGTTKVGHTFMGWFKDAELTELWDFAVDMVEGSMTLYAGWDVNEYELQYNGNGQTSGSANNVFVPYGETVTIKGPDTLQKTGYTFKGWSYTKNGGVDLFVGDQITMGAQNLKIYAVWE